MKTMLNSSTAAHARVPTQDEAVALARAAARDDAPLPAFAPVNDWCSISGLSRSRTYTLLGEGVLKAKRLGGRTLIDVRFGLAWLAALPDAEFSKASD